MWEVVSKQGGNKVLLTSKSGSRRSRHDQASSGDFPTRSTPLLATLVRYVYSPSSFFVTMYLFVRTVLSRMCVCVGVFVFVCVCVLFYCKAKIKSCNWRYWLPLWFSWHRSDGLLPRRNSWCAGVVSLWLAGWRRMKSIDTFWVLQTAFRHFSTFSTFSTFSIILLANRLIRRLTFCFQLLGTSSPSCTKINMESVCCSLLFCMKQYQVEEWRQISFDLLAVKRKHRIATQQQQRQTTKIYYGQVIIINPSNTDNKHNQSTATTHIHYYTTYILFHR